MSSFISLSSLQDAFSISQKHILVNNNDNYRTFVTLTSLVYIEYQYISKLTINKLKMRVYLEVKNEVKPDEELDSVISHMKIDTILTIHSRLI